MAGSETDIADIEEIKAPSVRLAFHQNGPYTLGVQEAAAKQQRREGRDNWRDVELNIRPPAAA